MREAHAGQWQFRDVRQPETWRQRMALAKKMRTDHDIETPIAVTAMDNKVQRGYGGLPNMAYLIGKDRTVLYKEPWANPAAWPPMFDRLLEHRDTAGADADDIVFGAGANVGPRTPRTAVPKRGYHRPDADAADEGDSDDSGEADEAEGADSGRSDEDEPQSDADDDGD